MRISIKFTANGGPTRWLAVAGMIASFSVVPASQVYAADKYATYGSLALFGRDVFTPGCLAANSLASVAFDIKGRRQIGPNLVSIADSPNHLTFTFGIINTLEFSAAAPLMSLQAWRTYPMIAAGVWDVNSVQQISNSVRLSDAIRFVVPTPSCDNLGLRSVEIVDGDLQVSTVGQPFPISNVRAKVNALDARNTPVNVSVALASELVEFESADTGIDGPRTAFLTDTNGSVTLTITPGSKPGIKRFIVKARNLRTIEQGTASTMLTLAHVSAGAPTVASVPVVEYAYAGGTGANPRYLASTTAATQLLDTSDDPTILRTGQVWRAFTAPNAATGLAAVCQFFGRPGAGVAVTHFFTADAAECDLLSSMANVNPTSGVGLKYEGVAFYAVTPDAQQNCPSNFPIPIIRYFVASPSPHHQYLVADTVRGQPINAPAVGAVREKIVFCTDVATAK